MSQCHDFYGESKETPAQPVPVPGAQCHDGYQQDEGTDNKQEGELLEA